MGENDTGGFHEWDVTGKHGEIWRHRGKMRNVGNSGLWGEVPVFGSDGIIRGKLRHGEKMRNWGS